MSVEHVNNISRSVGGYKKFYILQNTEDRMILLFFGSPNCLTLSYFLSIFGHFNSTYFSSKDKSTCV